VQVSGRRGCVGVWITSARITHGSSVRYSDRLIMFYDHCTLSWVHLAARPTAVTNNNALMYVAPFDVDLRPEHFNFSERVCCETYSNCSVIRD
jgi:hypothetical protein